MSKKGHRIAKEIKDEIIAKIKHEGLSVTDDGEVVSVSNTYWQSAEYVEQVEDGVVLSTPKGKIYFDEKLLEKIASL